MKIKYFVCQSIISLFFTLSAYTLWAQIPNGYYDAIEGKKDKDLKTALYQIISNNGFKVVGYSGLWDAIKTRMPVRTEKFGICTQILRISHL